MENIIEKVVDIDRQAKRIMLEQKQKQEDLDMLIAHEFASQKNFMDRQFENAIHKEQMQYNQKLEEEKKRIDSEIAEQLTKIENQYRQQEEQILLSVMKRMENGEE